ncbi:hypothetical protein PYW08_012935 [Mythimna loreyi]|uniref:Uncharacterized protein n=1 Tax=Mythimna loreyi TaxID=667449 RepID=A0ACC2PYW6_9NEOP|nr:hypothetical protein PYW08_012935 [Mythimna loreyi]
MAGVQRTPPGPSNTSQSTQSQTQPGPDTNTPIITSDYVNINRTKRARQGNSPQGATVEVEISSDVKNTQDDSITQTLLEQTKLMSKLLSEVSQIKTQNTQIQATNTEIRKSNEEIEKSMFCMHQNFEDLRKEVEDLRKERQEQQKYIESLEQKISDLQHRSRSSGVELRNVP